jgi:hypothetical protein
VSRNYAKRFISRQPFFGKAASAMDFSPPPENAQVTIYQEEMQAADGA